MPGIVQQYYPSNQTVDVQPSVHSSFTNEAGDRVAERHPVLRAIPVIFPGGGGFRCMFPLDPGDHVLIVFSEKSLDKWDSQGTEVDPGDDRRFALSDAVAIPGLRPSVSALSNAPTDTLSIGWNEGPTIELSDSVIRLGSLSASDDVVRASDLMNALKGALSDATIAAAISGVGLPGGAATLTAAVNTYFVAHPATGSPTVKAD